MDRKRWIRIVAVLLVFAMLVPVIIILADVGGGDDAIGQLRVAAGSLLTLLI